MGNHDPSADNSSNNTLFVQCRHDSIPVVSPGQALEDLAILVTSPGLGLFGGQHQVRIEVVGDEGRGQVTEVELEDGADTVDVMHHGTVPRQVGHSLLVK